MTVAPQNEVWKLIAVGDLLLGDSAICTGYGLASRYPRATDLSDLLSDCVADFQSGDLVFGNLEVLLAELPGPPSWETAQMRAAPALATALAKAGFTVLNIANNHAMQHGPDAFRETVSHLQAAGIAVCGLRGTGSWTSTPVLVDKPGHSSLVFLGYCLRPRQFGLEVPLYAEGTEQEIVADIKSARAQADTVIVSLHWGEEFVPRPSEPEVKFAHALIDAGAAAILGHHPHVLRPVELYRNGVIAYSLGNIIGDMIWYAPLRTGAVLHASLLSDRASQVELRPTHLDSHFRPLLREQAIPVLVSGPPDPMPPSDYAEAVRVTVRAQQLAAYRYAILRLFRYPPRLLTQLLARTLRNKLHSLWAAAVGSAHHQ